MMRQPRLYRGNMELILLHVFGALLYLSYTRLDIIYAVKKFAKYTRCLGVVHMEALLHLLRYLRDNMCLGLKFSSHFE